MNIHCTYCRHSFNLGRDYLVDAVDKAGEKRQKYHTLECPNCRKMIKVSIAQMKRYVPRQSEKPEEDQASS